MNSSISICMNEITWFNYHAGLQKANYQFSFQTTFNLNWIGIYRIGICLCVLLSRHSYVKSCFDDNGQLVTVEVRVTLVTLLLLYEQHPQTDCAQFKKHSSIKNVRANHTFINLKLLLIILNLTEMISKDRKQFTLFDNFYIIINNLGIKR